MAHRFRATLRGPADLVITQVGELDSSASGAIAFIMNPKYLPALKRTSVAAVILTERLLEHYQGPALVTKNPHACFARIAGWLNPEARPAAGIHATGAVDPGARVAASAAIGAYAIIEQGAVIGEDVVIGPGCFVGRGSVVGRGSCLHARVFVAHGCRIGEECIIHPGAVVGSDGFGFALEEGKWIKVPQLGGVCIGDRVEIGANTTIDRGALHDTLIGNGVKLDNLIQIAHNVEIGEDTAIAACVGIAGSTRIGKRCMIGGQVGIAGHLEIADDVQVLGKSLVAGSIREAGVYSASVKAERADAWRRNVARLSQLDDIARRLRELEKRISAESTKADKE